MLASPARHRPGHDDPIADGDFRDRCTDFHHLRDALMANRERRRERHRPAYVPDRRIDHAGPQAGLHRT